MKFLMHIEINRASSNVPNNSKRGIVICNFGHIRNMAKNCFSAIVPKVPIFGFDSSDRDNK